MNQNLMNMDFPALTDKDIYAVPAGDLWGTDPERIYMIYAPLGGHIALAAAADVHALERCAAGGQADTDRLRALSAFQAQGKVPVHRLPRSPHDLYQIDILLNYTCNFRCVYCYSAAGRSSGQVGFDKVKAVVDYLFCSGKKQENPYIINFSGGGEPLMSFPLIRQTVEYIREVSRGKDYIYNVGLVTNGSLITPEITDYLHSRNVDMAVSFEILPHLQDRERGSYGRVAANLDMMLDKGYPFGIRTTFTPESVGSMCLMIEELVRRFPRLKKVVFDTVLAPALFPTPESLESYYDTFLEEFYRAKALGKEKGISVESVAVETLSMVRDRTCEGKIVLTPMGTVSSCARVSSPREPLYGDYVYGRVEDGRLVFDQEKFARIMAESNIHTQPMCAGCFARWNCGGGCRLFHQSFPPAYEEVRCRFARKALKRQLFGVLSANFRQATGQDLHASVETRLRDHLI